LPPKSVAEVLSSTFTFGNPVWGRTWLVAMAITGCENESKTSDHNVVWRCIFIYGSLCKHVCCHLKCSLKRRKSQLNKWSSKQRRPLKFPLLCILKSRRVPYPDNWRRERERVCVWEREREGVRQKFCCQVWWPEWTSVEILIRKDSARQTLWGHLETTGDRGGCVRPDVLMEISQSGAGKQRRISPGSVEIPSLKFWNW
jgi:hypothetical protein